MLVFDQSGPTKLKTTKAHKKRDGFMSNRIPFGQARIRAALQCANAAVEAMTIFGPVCLSQKSALHPMQRLLSSRTNPSESLRTAPEEAHLLAHGVVAMVAPDRKAIGGKASVPIFVGRARRPTRPFVNSAEDRRPLETVGRRAAFTEGHRPFETVGIPTGRFAHPASRAT